MKLKFSTLRNLYIVAFGVLLGLVLATPFLINKNISIFRHEAIEDAVLVVLFVIGLFIYFWCQGELKDRREQIQKALGYIGELNVQIEQVRSIFNDIKKYPEDKNGFKILLKKFSDIVLGMVNADWVLFRIIELGNGKTLTENCQARGTAIVLKYEISNKDLIESKILDGYSVVESSQTNFNIRTFCIIPLKFINESQMVLLQAVVNNLGLYYLVLASRQNQSKY